MPLKPSILKNLHGIIGTEKFSEGQFVSEKDHIVLEDNKGRIKIMTSENFQAKDFITGSIIALKGKTDSAGFFSVSDHCYAGIPFKHEIPTRISLNQ